MQSGWDKCSINSSNLGKSICYISTQYQYTVNEAVINKVHVHNLLTGALTNYQYSRTGFMDGELVETNTELKNWNIFILLRSVTAKHKHVL